jgi:RNA polymerase sigma-70 factor (ECF subfamily)
VKGDTAAAPEPTEPAGTEAELLLRAASGELAAVRTLLDEAGPAVYGFIFARVGGQAAAAEDLTQETFVEAVRSAHTFRGESALRTWLCAIARRRIARYYESERRQEVVRAGLVAIGSAEDEELERRDEVIRALGHLPAIHRQVLVFKYMEQLTVDEIARELGRTPVQVQSLLQRARAGLRRQLERSDDDR